VKRLALGAAAWLVAATGAATPAAPTSCEACHADPARFAEEARRAVTAFSDDAHARVGLSCHDCHGGNPAADLAGSAALAMDREHAGNPYRVVPERRDVPSFCGRCHSDPVYMRRFRPDARVDQEREYATSRHGQELARGDVRVATCTDCHSAHGILAVDDPRSPVYPIRVADTCAGCHADAGRMAGYRRADGSPMPVDQYEQWRGSVHAAALLGRGDLAAPACNDCHGNHGAAPPGLDSLAFVCGRCHGREAELFRESRKRLGFERHNELYLAAAGPEGCAACHVAPEPQARLLGLRRFTECATCHGEHRVLRPTVGLLAPLPETPCALCHESPSPPAVEEQEPEAIRERYERTRDGLLAEAAGLEGAALFDWMIERMLALPPHHRADAPQGGGPQLLPSFMRLYERFRIGPVRAGERAEGPAEGTLRCDDCHSPEPRLAGEGAAYEVASRFVVRMRELSVLTARADRVLLRARRGGVEVREALAHLDQAVDAQIELIALVHGFHAAEGGAFARKADEGTEQARTALSAGRSALEELDARRRGLVAALVLVLCVLIGLGWRIRRRSSSELA
jgi:hypothetical protein